MDTRIQANVLNAVSVQIECYRALVAAIRPERWQTHPCRDFASIVGDGQTDGDIRQQRGARVGHVRRACLRQHDIPAGDGEVRRVPTDDIVRDRHVDSTAVGIGLRHREGVERLARQVTARRGRNVLRRDCRGILRSDRNHLSQRQGAERTGIILAGDQL